MALTPQQQLVYQRELNIRNAQESFWMFCCLLAPEFYVGSRWHLKLICETLQALYERRLTGRHFRNLCDMIAPVWYTLSVDWERLEPDKVYTRIMENIPPRSGKSRTLIMFCEWILGKNTKNRIITCSYNDDLASDFSRYTRDGIMIQKNLPTQIVYSDIFPRSRIQRGNSSFMQWALEGEFFNYKGAGVQGSITGKGGNVTIIDDPIKDAETAYNEGALEKIWQWYTGTFLSRLEDEGEGGIEIVNMTRWSKHDICGKILSGPEAHEWIILSMEACSPDGEMLCPGILSEKKYKSLKLVSDSTIFQANYHQQPVDVQGKLYQQILTYTDLPRDEEGNLLTERVISYTDTADTGNDYLCCICGHVYKGEGYVTDVYYTKDGMEITEPATADMLVNNNVTEAVIESNNGGRGFARKVEDIIWEKHKTRHVGIRWFHQSANKISRILTGATFIMQHIYFPVNWKDRWPDFYTAITNYQKEGKNKNDDGSDCLTGFGDLIKGGDYSGLIEFMRRQKEQREKGG